MVVCKLNSHNFYHPYTGHIVTVGFIWIYIFIILEMSSVEKSTSEAIFFVSFARLSEKTLLLFNKVHWFAKKGIKKFSFVLVVC